MTTPDFGESRVATWGSTVPTIYSCFWMLLTRRAGVEDLALVTAWLLLLCLGVGVLHGMLLMLVSRRRVRLKSVWSSLWVAVRDRSMTSTGAPWWDITARWLRFKWSWESNTHMYCKYGIRHQNYRLLALDQYQSRSATSCHAYRLIIFS